MRSVVGPPSQPRERARLSSLLVLGGVLSAGCGAPPDVEPQQGPCPAERCAAPGGQAQDLVGTRDFNVLQHKVEFNLTTRQANSELKIGHTQSTDCLGLPGPADAQVLSWTQLNNTPLMEEARYSSGLQHWFICTPEGEQVPGGLGTQPTVLKSTYTIPEQTHDYSQVGFSRRQDFSGGQFSYLLGWVESCDLFGPCDDATGQLTSVSFVVDHPANQLVLCPGVRTTLGNQKTQCALPPGTQAPTYSSFAVASNPNWQETQWLTAPVSVKFYEVPNGRLRPALNTAEVSTFLGWITGHLGALPYGPELRIASGPTDWLGMEHPANIILRDDLPLLRKDYANMTMHTLMHEVVHQWAGNQTTMATKWDFAWKEALAEYLTYLHEEQRGNGEPEQTRAYWDRQARTATYYLQPQDSTPPGFLSFINDVYGSGPMILFLQLEPLIGKDKVLLGIKRFLSSQNRSRSIDDLREDLQAVSGVDLAPYFNAWVKRSGEPLWPFFQVGAISRDRKNLSFEVEQRSDVYYPGHIEVEIQGPNNVKVAAVAKFELGSTQKKVRVNVTLPSAWDPQAIVFDPANKFVNRKSEAFFWEQKQPSWRL